MSRYIKVKDHGDLVRDTHSNAIISTNSDYYYAAKARKRKARNERKELDSLKAEMSEIKDLLKSVINKINES